MGRLRDAGVFQHHAAAGQDLRQRGLRPDAVLRVRRNLRNLLQRPRRQISGADRRHRRRKSDGPGEVPGGAEKPALRVFAPASRATPATEQRARRGVRACASIFRSSSSTRTSVPEKHSGTGIRALAEAIEEGLEVLGHQLRRPDSFAQQQSRGSAFIPPWIDEGTLATPEEKADRRAARLRHEIRNRNADIPIFLHGETRTSATSPTTCCASCTVSSTCSRTRRSSSPATSCARPPISTRCRRPSSAP